jgi:ABC-2 type transport system permease protein
LNDSAQPMPLARATWLMMRLRMRRFVNAFASASLRRPKPGDTARKGTAGKSRTSFILALVVLPSMLFALGQFAYTALANLNGQMGGTGFPSGEFGGPLTAGIAFLVFMVCLTALLITGAARDLMAPDWDLEWLVTLPMNTGTLLWSRVLERTLMNLGAVFALIAGCTVIAWASGLRWSAPLAGLLASLPLLLLIALMRTIFDTGLRLVMKPAQLKNLQAVVAIGSVVILYLTMSMGTNTGFEFMLRVAAGAPPWLTYTPFGLVVVMLNAHDAGDCMVAALAYLAEVVVITWAGIALVRHQLRNGVVASGGSDAGVRAPVSATAPPSTSGPSLRSPVHRRELTLLRRDRNFLVQCLVLPVVAIGAQIIMSQQGPLDALWSNSAVLASVAFGLAMYSLSMSGFQTLNSEGQALWMLFTMPRSIDSVLKEKAQLWGVLSLVYPIVMFAVGIVMLPVMDARFVTCALTALVGVPIFAFIAVSLGVFGCDPLAQEAQHKIRMSYFYLFITLAAFYGYAIHTDSMHQRLVSVSFTLLLAFALWQKARDHLPYLLDPTAAPPARVSTSDGLMAVMLFYVVQVIAGAVMGRDGKIDGSEVLIAFSIAGAVAFALTRLVYWRTRAEGVPRVLGAPLGLTLRAGLSAGVVAALFGVAYLIIAAKSGLLEDAAKNVAALPALGWWVVPITVIAAPLCEEFLFRGLIYTGLRRSFGVGVGVLASAAIFAVIHPAIGIVPVFMLGICTALAYERTKTLAAPILTHAIYNACVVGFEALAI